MKMPARRPHIANIDFPRFYAAAVGSVRDARALYESLSNANTKARGTAKIMLHQAARMIWLGDRIERVARGRPALQITFFMIAAEAVAKLAAGYEKEGDSKKHVRMFFDIYCNEAQRKRLYEAVRDSFPHPPKSGDEVADFLYRIRCDVVHRGRYFDRTLSKRESLQEIRAVVLEAVVVAVRKVSGVGP